jgi:beta-galactosidase
MKNFQAALLRAGINVDMIRPGQDLSGYKMVVASEIFIMPDTLAKQLDAFVKGGGVLVTNFRTGVKDETNLCHVRTLPGLLSDALGIRIDEYEAIAGGSTYPLAGSAELSGSWTADCYADWVTATKAETLAKYQPWHVASYAAVTRNRYGSGWGYYVGANIKEEAFYETLLRDALTKAGVKAVVTPPAGVEVSVREGSGKKLLFVLNHTEEPKTVTAPSGAAGLLGDVQGDKVGLGAYGVAVLKLA